jgi:hypothetical protein
MSKPGPIDLVPEAGGHPTRLVTAAAEYVRAANHATFARRPVPGLASGADLFNTVAALHLLTSRLPQLCEQLADLLGAGGGHGTLTGPADAPQLAATELRHAWRTLSPVGGWLSPNAQALSDQEG